MKIRHFHYVSCFLLITHIASAVLANPAASSSEENVAMVNGKPITRMALDQLVTQAKASGAIDTPNMRIAMRDQLIARELFLQEAVRQQLTGEPAVQQAMRQARDAAMIQLYLERTLKPAKVTEEEIRKQYDWIVENLGKREYLASLIQVVRQEDAQTVMKQLDSGASFDLLARKHSLAITANQPSQIGWISFREPLDESRTNGVPLPLAQMITKLKPGQHGGPVGWNGHWFILRLDQERATQIPAYDAVKGGLRQSLEQAVLDRSTAELIKRLKSNARIDMK